MMVSNEQESKTEDSVSALDSDLYLHVNQYLQ